MTRIVFTGHNTNNYFYILVPQGPLSFLSNWLAVCAPVLVYVGWRDLKLDTDLHLYAGGTGQLGAARICSGH